MNKPLDTEDEEEVVYFQVPVRLSTMPLLMALAECCDDEPAKIMGSIVHDVLMDDARAHGDIPMPSKATH